MAPGVPHLYHGADCAIDGHGLALGPGKGKLITPSETTHGMPASHQIGKLARKLSRFTSGTWASIYHVSL